MGNVKHSEVLAACELQEARLGAHSFFSLSLGPGRVRGMKLKFLGPSLNCWFFPLAHMSQQNWLCFFLSGNHHAPGIRTCFWWLTFFRILQEPGSEHSFTQLLSAHASVLVSADLVLEKHILISTGPGELETDCPSPPTKPLRDSRLPSALPVDEALCTVSLTVRWDLPSSSALYCSHLSRCSSKL